MWEGSVNVPIRVCSANEDPSCLKVLTRVWLLVSAEAASQFLAAVQGPLCHATDPAVDETVGVGKSSPLRVPVAIA